MLIFLNKLFGRVEEKMVKPSSTKSRKGKRKPPKPVLELVSVETKSTKERWQGGFVSRIGLIVSLCAFFISVMVPIGIAMGVMSFAAAFFFKLPGVVAVFKVLTAITCSVRGVVDEVMKGVKNGAGGIAGAFKKAKQVATDIVGSAANGLKAIPVVGGTLGGMLNFGGKIITSPLLVVEKASDLFKLGAEAILSLNKLVCGLQAILKEMERNGTKDAYQKALSCADWDASRYGQLKSPQNSTKDGKPKYCIDGEIKGEDNNYFIPNWLLGIYQEASRKYNVPWELLAAVNINDTNLGSGQWMKANEETGGRLGWIPFSKNEWYGIQGVRAKAVNDAGATAPNFYGDPYSNKRGYTVLPVDPKSKDYDPAKPYKRTTVEARTCPAPVDTNGVPWQGGVGKLTSADNATTSSDAGLDGYTKGKLTAEQVGQLLLQVGFPKEEVYPGIVAAYLESKFDPEAVQGAGSDPVNDHAAGLWQMLGSEKFAMMEKYAAGKSRSEIWKDPVVSTKVALDLYKAAQKSTGYGWQPWQAMPGGVQSAWGSMSGKDEAMKIAKEAAEKLGAPITPIDQWGKSTNYGKGGGIGLTSAGEKDRDLSLKAIAPTLNSFLNDNKYDGIGYVVKTRAGKAIMKFNSNVSGKVRREDAYGYTLEVVAQANVSERNLDLATEFLKAQLSSTLQSVQNVKDSKPAAGTVIENSDGLKGPVEGLATTYNPSAGGINGREGGGSFVPTYTKGWAAAKLGSASLDAGWNKYNWKYPSDNQKWHGWLVRVTNQENGKTIEVPISDIGPGAQGTGGRLKTLDLLPEPMKALGGNGNSTIKIAMKPLRKLSRDEVAKYARGDKKGDLVNEKVDGGGEIGTEVQDNEASVNVSFDPDAQYDNCDPVDSIFGLAQWLSMNGASGQIWQEAYPTPEELEAARSKDRLTKSDIKTDQDNVDNNSNYRWPVKDQSGKIGQGPNEKGGTHDPAAAPNNWQSDNAVDVMVDEGTELVAVADGTISDSAGFGTLAEGSSSRFAGKRFTLVDDQGRQWYYAHLKTLDVKPGQKVKKGDLVGTSGSANNVAHLHLAVDKDNPRELLEGGAGSSGAATGQLIWPVTSTVTSLYGNRGAPCAGCSSNHKGVDFGAALGTPIHPVLDGTVSYIGHPTGYGSYICVTHGDKLTTCYAHVSRFGKFKVGSKITQKDVVAYVGHEGVGTGDHLHLNVYKKGLQKNENPPFGSEVNPTEILGNLNVGLAVKAGEFVKGGGKVNISDGSSNDTVNVQKTYLPSCFTQNAKKFGKLEDLIRENGKTKNGFRAQRLDTCLGSIPKPSIEVCQAGDSDVESQRVKDSLAVETEGATKTYQLPNRTILEGIIFVQSRNGCALPRGKDSSGWAGFSEEQWDKYAVNTTGKVRYYSSTDRSTDSAFALARYLKRNLVSNSKDEKEKLLLTAEKFFKGNSDDSDEVGEKMAALRAYMTAQGEGDNAILKSNIGKAVQRRNYRIDSTLSLGTQQPCKDDSVYAVCIAKLYKIIVLEYETPSQVDREADNTGGVLPGGCGKTDKGTQGMFSGIGKLKISDVPDLTIKPYSTKGSDVVLNKERKNINVANQQTYGRRDAMKGTIAVIKAFQNCFPEYKKKWQDIQINDWGSQVVGSKYGLPGGNGHLSHRNGGDNDFTIKNVTSYQLPGQEYDRKKAIVLAALFLRAGAYWIFFDDPELQQFFIQNRKAEAKLNPSFKKRYKAWSDAPVNWAYGGVPGSSAALSSNSAHHNHFHVRWYNSKANESNPTVKVYLGSKSDTDSAVDDKKENEKANQGPWTTGALGIDQYGDDYVEKNKK